jgi:hypothetical protein
MKQQEQERLELGHQSERSPTSGSLFRSATNFSSFRRDVSGAEACFFAGWLLHWTFCSDWSCRLK